MPPPIILAASSTELNVTWDVPDVLESRGDIIMYRIYRYEATDLSNSPFAPPYMWLVSTMYAQSCLGVDLFLK